MERIETLDVSSFPTLETKTRRLATRIISMCYNQEVVEQTNIGNVKVSKNIADMLKSSMHFTALHEPTNEDRLQNCIGFINQFKLVESNDLNNTVIVGNEQINVIGL